MNEFDVIRKRIDECIKTLSAEDSKGQPGKQETNSEKDKRSAALGNSTSSAKKI